MGTRREPGLDSKLMEMLCGYAAAHRHPFNVAVHLVGIPVIMLGVFIAFSRFTIEIDGFAFNLAHVTLVVLFLFYLTLDVIFALAFLAMGAAVAWLAALAAAQPSGVAWTASAAAFFGGYALQFVGHAVERSAPVILKRPVQANLAAPFFTVVEIFHLTGLRKSLFDAVQARIDETGSCQPADS
jgi:uncharacterized membrane protein YGL010W